MTKIKFRDLAIGDTFDFVDDARINSFYERCKKTGPRTYQAIVSESNYRVGSINANVFHVLSWNANTRGY